MFGLFKRKKKSQEAAQAATKALPEALSEDLPEAQPVENFVEAPPIVETPPIAEILPVIETAVETTLTEAEKPAAAPKKVGLFARLKQGLARTGSGLADLFLGSRKIDDELLEELETRLLMADVGMTATQEIISSLTEDRKSVV